MKTRLFSVLIIFAFFIHTPYCLAEKTIWDLAESDKYSEKIGGMLGRGSINILTSPMDLVSQTINETEKGPLVGGTLIGIGKGVGYALIRIGSGVLDIASFWIPNFNGLGVRPIYKDCPDTVSACRKTSSPVKIKSEPKPLPVKESVLEVAKEIQPKETLPSQTETIKEPEVVLEEVIVKTEEVVLTEEEIVVPSEIPVVNEPTIIEESESVIVLEETPKKKDAHDPYEYVKK